MAEEDVRLFGVLLFGNLHEHMAVADKVFPAVLFAEIAELIIVFNALSVTQMIVDINGKAVVTKDGSELFISFKMLRHSVGYLDNSLYAFLILGKERARVNIRKSGNRRKIKFFFNSHNNTSDCI